MYKRYVLLSASWWSHTISLPLTFLHHIPLPLPSITLSLLINQVRKLIPILPSLHTLIQIPVLPSILTTPTILLLLLLLQLLRLYQARLLRIPPLTVNLVPIAPPIAPKTARFYRRCPVHIITTSSKASLTTPIILPSLPTVHLPTTIRTIPWLPSLSYLTIQSFRQLLCLGVCWFYIRAFWKLLGSWYARGVQLPWHACSCGCWLGWYGWGDVQSVGLSLVKVNIILLGWLRLLSVVL